MRGGMVADARSYFYTSGAAWARWRIEISSAERMDVRSGSKHFFKKCNCLQVAASLCNWVQERVRCGWMGKGGQGELGGIL